MTQADGTALRRGRGTLAVGFVLALSGCGAHFVTQTLYPGGQMFRFTTADGDQLYYGCAAQGPGGDSAGARAAAAHRHFTRETDRFADRMTTRLMDALDRDEDEDAFGRVMAAETDRFAQQAMAEMQRRFACALVETE